MEPVIRGRFDPQKLADLTTREGDIRSELNECTEKIHGLATKAQGTSGLTDPEKDTYQLLSMDHMRHETSLRNATDARERYELREPDNAKAKTKNAFARWVAVGPAGLDDDERKEFINEVNVQDLQTEGNGIDLSALDQNGAFRIRGDTASDAASGQEAVQETIQPTIIDRLAYFGGISQMAHQFMTGTGNDFRWPQVDGSTEEGEILGAQATAVGNDDINDIGVISFGAKTGSSKTIKITREMIQDSVVDIQAYGERTGARRLGRIWDKFFTVTQAGTHGIVGVSTVAKAGLTTAANTGFTYAEVNNMIYTINRAYREMGGEMGEGGFMNDQLMGRLGWLMSDGAEKVFRGMTDTDGRPLWLPSMRDGLPATIHGFPYGVSGNLPDVAASAVAPVMFGNFGYFGIRTINEVEMFRFWDSNTASTNSVHLLAFSRRDSKAMGAVVSTKCEAISKMTIKA